MADKKKRKEQRLYKTKEESSSPTISIEILFLTCIVDTIEGRTIVLTGALAPARFAESDAVFNVGMAFGAVQSLPAGVYICMNGQVFEAAEVVKDRSRNAFVLRSESNA